MWPGQQPPGGEQNPQDANQNPYQQPGYQQPNPYQQPGYQQPNPYQQQGGYPQTGEQQGYQQPGSGQWNAPSLAGQPQAPQGGGSGGGGGDRTKLVAIIAASAVVVAAGVTGYLVLGKDDGKKSDTAKGGGDKTSSAPKSPSASASEEENPRGTGSNIDPVIPGWKVVVNPKRGVAFDVPADWEVDSPSMMVGFEDDKSEDGKPLIIMSAPAYFKKNWCESDEDKDGSTENTPLATVGTKGANGAKDTNEVAVNQVAWWVFGGYTQPDKKSVKADKKSKEFTTKSGIKGSYAWARSENTPEKGKCATDGKAITFGFKNSANDFVAWNLHGPTGVDDELSDETIMKIMSTVRLSGDPTETG
ncbi:proline-rich domain-containing protein [Streptomyces indicus]|nr:proline-rich domain-containing protein [Streptomyces indicus]